MLAAFVGLLAAASPPVLELELAGGFAHTLEDGGYPGAVPALQGRVAVDALDTVALGLTAFAVLGGEAENDTGACCGGNSGNQAFSAVAALLTLRLHTSGPTQFWGEAGFGTGHLISLQTDNAFEHPPLRGHAGLGARLAVGLRHFLSQRLLAGAELAWMHWTNVEQGPNAGCCVAPAQYGLSTSALLLLVSIGFAVGR